MTVSTTNSTQSFAGTQSTLTFTFQALPDHPEYIQVINRVIATGYESALTYTTNYTVSMSSTGVGGVVTLVTTYGSGVLHIVKRVTSPIQSSEYDDYSAFPSSTLEENLDGLTLLAQERQTYIDDPSDKLSAWARFDGTGAGPITPTAVYNVSSSVTKVGTGSYIAFFLPTFSASTYGVVVGGNALVGVATSTGTNCVSISTTNLSGTATDYSNISVVVFRN